MKKGIFITLEGPEGSGKSSHIRMMAAYLKRTKRRVVITREPGGTPLSGQFRQILLNTGKDLTPMAELFLYEADRAQHVEQIIRPALAKGAIVLCDRYTDSTLVYQGYGRGLDRKAIQILNDIATDGFRPDLTILLDVPTKLGLARAHSAKKGHDRLEKAGIAFHRRVRRGYLALAKQDPKRFRMIPSMHLVKAQEQIESILKARFKL